MEKNDKLLCIKQVSDLFGVKESWIRSKIHKKILIPIKLGRLIRFKWSDLQEIINKGI